MDASAGARARLARAAAAPRGARRVVNRVLVVNADEFGRSRGVNEGVAEAHERGIVTSASLMVRRPHAGDAAAYARAKPALSVGLHVDLGEWTYREGEGWAAVYEVEPRDVYAQVAR